MIPTLTIADHRNRPAAYSELGGYGGVGSGCGSDGIDIGFGEFGLPVSAATGPRLSDWAMYSAFGDGICHVVSAGTNEQMVAFHTVPYVAGVTDIKTFWYLTEGFDPRNAVDILSLTPEVRLTVAADGGDVASPQPAGVGLVDGIWSQRHGTHTNTTVA